MEQQVPLELDVLAEPRVPVELEEELLHRVVVAEEDLEVVLVPVVIPVETLVDHWKAVMEVLPEWL